MKKLLFIVIFALLPAISHASGSLVTDTSGQRIQGCATALAKDAAIGDAYKASVSVASDLCFILTTASTTSGCIFYKSDSTSSAGKVAVPVAASAQVSRVVGRGVTYLIYSSCSGARLERQ